MADVTFLQRLAEVKSMPDYITDVRDFQLVKTRHYPAELKEEAFRALYAEASDDQRRELPYLVLPDELSAVYARELLCRLFLQSEPAEQSRLRDSPLAQALNYSSISQNCYRINAVDAVADVQRLREGLAAAVLLDGRDDYRDILTALATLWLAAARAGIEPAPYFEEAARTAGKDNPNGVGSTHDVLANFHSSANFKEEVEPYLHSEF